jgi:3-phenylpropionate/trans-cinnamate dioxygenase ferredoxin subunit
VAKFVVAAVESFPPGTTKRVEIGGRGIAVFNADGTFYAVRDVCPHQGARLSAGQIVGWIRAKQPGCYQFDTERKFVRCPWHGWEYDLATGQSWYNPRRDRIRAYEVSVESGEKVVADADELVPGPHVVETIAISVENDYVVVDV